MAGGIDARIWKRVLKLDYELIEKGIVDNNVPLAGGRILMLEKLVEKLGKDAAMQLFDEWLGDTVLEVMCGLCNKKCKEAIGCDAKCKQWFHLSCAKVTTKEFTFLKSKPNFKWFCSVCESHNDGIESGSHGNMEDELKEVKDEMKKITEVLKVAESERMNYTNRNSTQSYASALIKGVSKQSETVVIAINADENGEIGSYKSVKEDVMSKLNPSTLGIGIRNVKPGGKGKMEINCDSVNSRLILKREALKVLGGKYQIEEMKKGWRPRLIIKGLWSDAIDENDNELAKNIIHQNALDEKGAFVKKILCYQDRRFVNQKMLVIEVDNETRKKLLESGYLNLGWCTGRVEDYIYVKRCYKCASLGHTQKDCQKNKRCPLCGESHDMSQCSSKNEDFKCVNCLDANDRLHMNLNVQHSSLNKDCRCYVRQVAALESRICYA